MSTLSLSVASGQGVLASPSTVLPSSALNVSITWISGKNVSSGDPQPTASDTESAILSAVAPTPSLVSIPNTSIDSQSTTHFTLTVTETLTIFVPAPSSSSPSLSAAPLQSMNPKSPIMEWKSPRRMHDLDAFNISAFAGGKDNLEIVQGKPDKGASVSISSISSSSADSDPDLNLKLVKDQGPDKTPIFLTSHKNQRSRTKWRNNESSVQLFYPAGSINPGQRPVGGAQFYATPLDLTSARNVSLGYSVFFPANFDWVLGGKMPGLYGGHAGCSGGNAALDCWSTRLMWRKEGEGELYLYAPKDKQTPELCNDPRSTCDSKYGFSIGRGSFVWGAGRWTSVLQTVTLNTPGKQDGSFTLDVDGMRVIDRSDVFYRDVLPTRGPGDGTSSSNAGEVGGGLGGLLGTLLSDLFRREYKTGGPVPTSTSTSTTAAVLLPMQMYEAQHGWALLSTPAPGPGPAPASEGNTGPVSTSTSTTLSTTTTTTAAADDPQPTPPPNRRPEGNISVEAPIPPPVGFKGLFFSSFFGGHSARYATPTDQYTWFKDFYMSYNA